MMRTQISAVFISTLVFLASQGCGVAKSDYDGMPSTGTLKAVDAVAAGADPSGKQDSAPALTAAVAKGGVKLTIPCGVFLLKANVPLPSNTAVVGHGKCTELRIDPLMVPNERFGIILPTNTNIRSVFSNADFVGGNSNISIKEVRVTSPVPLVRGQYHAFSFYRADHVTVDSTLVEGTGTIHDGNDTVFILSNHFRYTNNRHVGGGGEASFDIWDGASDFVVSHNYCDGGYHIQRCFTVNGLSSGNLAGGFHNTARTTSNGIVSYNVADHVKNVGIMIVGLYSPGPPPVYGHLHNIFVTHNTVDGVARFHGIWIGEADKVKVLDNTISNAAASCIYVASAGAGGDTEDIDVENNTCENSGRSAAIMVGNSKDTPRHVSLVNNSVSASEPGYAYAVRIDRGATDTVVRLGATRAGTVGTLLNQGAQ